MKSLRKTLGLALITLVIFGMLYPLAMVGIASVAAPYASDGKPIYKDDQLVGFENVGQNFNSPRYFWSRPSAVGYDASSTGGSNLGPTNPEFLKLVESRIDTLIKYHPNLKESEIPVDLVTASGSGLDPHISKEAALIQLERVAQNRGLSVEALQELVKEQVESPLWGFAGPGGYVNVLKLNLALDQFSEQNSNNN